MRRLTLALVLPVACLSIHADSTGRISGKVVNKAGQPIVGAKINLKRTDRNWTKDLISDKTGSFLQVGMEPKDYLMTVTAEGYVALTEQVKIPLGDVVVKNVSLLTANEARAAAGAQVAAADPGAGLDTEGRESFNSAIPLYNSGNFSEALPLIEKSYKTLNEAKEKLKDEKAKEELAPELIKIERVLGICIAQAGAKKEDAEPYLLKALARNAKDERVLMALIETSKAKSDKAAEQKYTTQLETLQGPNPDAYYNKGVDAFNSGRTKEAKTHWLKTLEIAPTYAEAHFMLAMVEFGENNLKGTKQNLEKYLELAPNGKNAATAKEMLKDPSLKRIK
ncbi:carboxypeptidase regulatory-like domain-containing protein [Geothrix sp. PMB-07]|uniref:carboxypeptidase regulatory-like domain-containing protein n=1 Tax=Geothrix sp. PMB-07 TaxID=3068640 RepID=UPI00274076D0|nr:carboxypeptidase regulatory-like domain-containing protein [Geothrix sp. PMB-07]WLT33363.1 carboxypeptidase regulatory-like domain-containing protein [Geothrix sp. PMB-07]